MTDLPMILSPSNPFLWATIGVAVAIAFVVLKFVVQHKEPGGRRLGPVIISMKVGELGKGMLYELEEWMQEPNLEALKEIEEAKETADYLIKNKKDLWLGIIQFEKFNGATLEDGLAIVCANRNMFHSEYSKDVGNYYDIFRGRMYLKLVNQALSPGRVFRDVPDMWNSKSAHFIYYPMQSFDDSEVVNVIENPYGTIGVLANVKQAVQGLYDVKQIEAKLRATSKNLDLATSDNARLTGEKGFVEIQFSKKSPFTGAETFLNKALSTLAIIGIVGASAIFLPDVLQRQFPGYTSQHYIAFAIAIGAIGVMIVEHFKK